MLPCIQFCTTAASRYSDIVGREAADFPERRAWRYSVRENADSHGNEMKKAVMLVAAVALSACSSGNKEVKSDDGANPAPDTPVASPAEPAEPAEPAAAQAVQELMVGDCAGPGDPLTIDAVSVEGDVLVIQAGYSGGCEEHDIVACWDGTFMETAPVQVTVGLSHDAHGDQCEAYARPKLQYSLTKLKEAYVSGYNSPTGTIMIGVDAKSAEYTF